jgi:hypothetical protein
MDATELQSAGNVMMQTANMASILPHCGIQGSLQIQSRTNPQASAIYWARRGLAKSAGNDRTRLEHLIGQAETLYKKLNRKEKL